MFVNGSGRNEQSLQRTFHRCFLPNFGSFSYGVSEEKIKMWKVNGRQTTDDGCQVMAKAHIACLWQGELKRLYITEKHNRNQQFSFNNVKVPLVTEALWKQSYNISKHFLSLYIQCLTLQVRVSVRMYNVWKQWTHWYIKTLRQRCVDNGFSKLRQRWKMANSQVAAEVGIIIINLLWWT